MFNKIREDLQRLADAQRAKTSASFFKTGRGQYGEGDVFLGITVPETRAIAKKYSALSFSDLTKLLESKIHEYRLVALLILVERFKKADASRKEKIYEFYLRHTQYVNNWDLVDLSAYQIIGAHLFDKDRKKLYALANSSQLWEKRIAIVATFEFIRKHQFEDTLKIAEILLQDKHDLIHKAVGWMLREVGKKNQQVEEKFLKKHAQKMPRTMLRYAIERFDEQKRRVYLKK